MLVKLIRDNKESEWISLTKKQHREMLSAPPEAVVVNVDDLYPHSPDKGTLIKLEFSLFTVLARDFVLQENRQEKQAERHHEKCSIDDASLQINRVLFVSVEDEYVQKETREMLEQAYKTLTKVQERRFRLFYEDKLSLREIAGLEGVHNTAVEDSISAARKKLKIFYKSTSAKFDFLSD